MSILVDSEGYKIIDQLKIPEITVYIPITDTLEAWQAIKKMQVRGAPAIAIVGCLGVASEISKLGPNSKDQLHKIFCEKMDYITTARPTAVNIHSAAAGFKKMSEGFLSDATISEADMKAKLISEIEAMLHADISDNKAIGSYGADDILKSSESPVTVLTHCNTGALATAGYGTALGVIRALNEKEMLKSAYCTETRPYNQGARLTAYELVQEKIDGTLICDSMVGILMQKQKIHAVVVGADRVAANGDTANKIGTYQIAILAKHHNVPFYVAAPFSSIDLNIPSGENIPIELRPQEELCYISGTRIAAEGIKCWNPSFDVTPAQLITGGIITEKGVYKLSGNSFMFQ